MQDCQLLRGQSLLLIDLLKKSLLTKHRSRYQSTLQYELLDTFPDIFEAVSATRSVAVHSRLSTTTGVAGRVKVLQTAVARMIGLDEREALSNGLGEIVEAYQDGWSSGSDDDSDD